MPMNPLETIRRKVFTDRSFLRPELLNDQPEILAWQRWAMVNYLHTHRSASAPELAEAAQIDRASAYHHIAILEECGVIRPKHNGISKYGKRYVLTFDLTEYVAHSFNPGTMFLLFMAGAATVGGLATRVTEPFTRTALFAVALTQLAVAAWLFLLLRGRVIG